MKDNIITVTLNSFQGPYGCRNKFGMTMIFLTLLLCVLPAYAESETVDLILPPALVSKDAPFYEGAQVKIGDTLMPVRLGDLPDDQLAAFNPDDQELVISDSKTATEEDKGKALFDVLDALQAGAIAPAAGR